MIAVRLNASRRTPSRREKRRVGAGETVKQVYEHLKSIKKLIFLSKRVDTKTGEGAKYPMFEDLPHPSEKTVRCVVRVCSQSELGCHLP